MAITLTRVKNGRDGTLVGRYVFDDGTRSGDLIPEGVTIRVHCRVGSYDLVVVRPTPGILSTVIGLMSGRELDGIQSVRVALPEVDCAMVISVLDDTEREIRCVTSATVSSIEII